LSDSNTTISKESFEYIEQIELPLWQNWLCFVVGPSNLWRPFVIATLLNFIIVGLVSWMIIDKAINRPGD